MTRLSPWSGELVSFHFSSWRNFVQHLLPAGSSTVLVPFQVLPECDLKYQCQCSVKCLPQALSTVSSALKFRKASGLVAAVWAPQGPVFSLLFSLSGPEPEPKVFWTAWGLSVTAMAVGVDTVLSAGRSSRKLALTLPLNFPFPYILPSKNLGSGGSSLRSTQTLLTPHPCSPLCDSRL